MPNNLWRYSLVIIVIAAVPLWLLMLNAMHEPTTVWFFNLMGWN